MRTGPGRLSVDGAVAIVTRVQLNVAAALVQVQVARQAMSRRARRPPVAPPMAGVRMGRCGGKGSVSVETRNVNPGSVWPRYDAGGLDALPRSSNAEV